MRDHEEYAGQFLWAGVVDYLGESHSWPYDRLRLRPYHDDLGAAWHFRKDRYVLIECLALIGPGALPFNLRP